jgi:hypothetical protein
LKNKRIKDDLNMRSFFAVVFLLLTLSVGAFAQDEMNSKGEPVAKNEQNAPVELKRGDKITRGAALGKGVKRVKVEKALAAAAPRTP